LLYRICAHDFWHWIGLEDLYEDLTMYGCGDGRAIEVNAEVRE
jgi:hypothetical protein